MIDAAIIPLKEHFSALDDPRASISRCFLSPCCPHESIR
jgi:hypothetical protein